MNRGCNGGGCRQGRMPESCDCELACELGPDADRVIQPPARTPEDDAYIARARRVAVFVAVAAFSALAALLGIADARWQP